MSLKEAIAAHLADKPEALARWTRQQEEGVKAAQTRPNLFVDADAYSIPDIPVRIDGVILLASGDISLRDYVAVTEGRISEAELALTLFRKHHGELPLELLQEHVGMVRLMKAFAEVMKRISTAQADLQETGEAAFEEPASGGMVIRAPQNGTSPVIPADQAPPFASRGAAVSPNGSA